MKFTAIRYASRVPHLTLNPDISLVLGSHPGDKWHVGLQILAAPIEDLGETAEEFAKNKEFRDSIKRDFSSVT